MATDFPWRNYILSWGSCAPATCFIPGPRASTARRATSSSTRCGPVDEGADHARPFRPCACRPWRGAGDARDAGVIDVRYGADLSGRKRDWIWRCARSQWRQGVIPPGRPCAGLGADPDGISGRNCRRLPATIKRRHDPTCAPFEPIPCDVFITEATFGLPVFRHPPDTEEIARLLKSAAQFPERSHLVGAYALGKAQRVMRLLRDAGYDKPLYIHGALARLSEYYQSQGIDLGTLEPATVEGGKGDFAGAIVVGPPSAFADRWARRFAIRSRCFASGWMRMRQRAEQRGGRTAADHLGPCRLGRTDRHHQGDRRRGNLGHARPRGSAGALVRTRRHRGKAAASRRL